MKHQVRVVGISSKDMQYPNESTFMATRYCPPSNSLRLQRLTVQELSQELPCKARHRSESLESEPSSDFWCNKATLFVFSSGNIFRKGRFIPRLYSITVELPLLEIGHLSHFPRQYRAEATKPHRVLNVLLPWCSTYDYGRLEWFTRAANICPPSANDGFRCERLERLIYNFAGA